MTNPSAVYEDVYQFTASRQRTQDKRHVYAYTASRHRILLSHLLCAALTLQRNTRTTAAYLLYTFKILIPILLYFWCSSLYGFWMTVLPCLVTAIRQSPWGVPRGITTTTYRVISHCIAVPVHSVPFKKIVCRAWDMGPHAIYSTSRSNVQWSTLGIRRDAAYH